MEKINVYISINDYKISTVGEIDNNIIACLDGDTKINYNINNKVLIKESLDSKIVIDFVNCEIRINLFEVDGWFINKLVLKSYEDLGNKIKIVYMIDENIYNLTIMYKNKKKILEK